MAISDEMKQELEGIIENAEIVKAMFKEVQKLGILNTFTPLEVVRDQ